MKAKVAKRIAALIALAITILSAIGAYLAVRWDNNWPYIVVAVGTASMCFFGLLFLTQKDDEHWQLTEETMRTAIAGTIVVVYLVLVGIVAFFVVGPGPRDLPGITQTMITNFTTVVGIVIAFYFGASAYVQAQREKTDSRKGKSAERNENATATPEESSKE
jgi:protein-S-isoprenylcysteine O-methyltransferase Ste14